MDCVYIISLPQGFRVNVTFMEFELETRAVMGFGYLTFENGDYLQMKDGISIDSPPIGTNWYYRKDIETPQSFQSTHNNMWIR